MTTNQRHAQDVHDDGMTGNSVSLQPSGEVSSRPKANAEMSLEINRLATFARAPSTIPKSLLLFARYGFAYTESREDKDCNVICCFCYIKKSDWVKSDVISEVHKRLSPQCPIVTGINCNNVPITTGQCWTTVFGQLQLGNRSTSSGQCRNETQSNPAPEQPQRTTTALSTSGHKHLSTTHTQMAVNTVMHPPVATPALRSGIISPTVNAHQSASENVPNAIVTSISRLGHNAESGFQASRSNGPSVGSPVQNGSQRQTATIATNLTTNTNSASTTNVARSSTSSVPISTSVTRSSNNTSRNPSITAQTTAARSSITTPSKSSAATTSVNTANTAQSSSINSQGSKQLKKGTTHSDQAISTDTPKRSEFAMKSKRLESFGSWPKNHHLKKEDLADAGFYYAGYDDCTECFHCGRGLKRWKAGVDAWIEHARWFPHCAFIRQAKGQAFVDVVQGLHKEHDKITLAMVLQRLGAAADTFQLDDGILSADKLLEKPLQNQKTRTQRSNAADSQVVGISSNSSVDEEIKRTLGEQNSQMRQHTTCKICHDQQVAVIFLPCRHMVSCTDCAPDLKVCTVCKTQIKGLVRAFLS